MPRFGYPCVSELLGRTTNHTCQLRHATPERLRGLIERNLDDLNAILRHNAAHDWRLFRIGSSCIPFASHPVNTIPWWREYKQRLAEIGQFAQQAGIRLSMHPGQYTVLNSPNEQTVSTAIAEIAYSAQLLEALGAGIDGKIVLHIGGVYRDKTSAIERFISVARELPLTIKERLVIENDDSHYHIEDVLSISEQSGLPVVFDNLHHTILTVPTPIHTLIARVFATWDASDGPPKVHFASQALGEKIGKHAAMADAQEFIYWSRIWQASGPFDVMLEAKSKDIALKQLLSSINTLEG